MHFSISPSCDCSLAPTIPCALISSRRRCFAAGVLFRIDPRVCSLAQRGELSSSILIKLSVSSSTSSLSEHRPGPLPDAVAILLYSVLLLNSAGCWLLAAGVSCCHSSPASRGWSRWEPECSHSCSAYAATYPPTHPPTHPFC